MKILLLADEECKGLWDYYTPGKLDGYDLILAAGDLKGEYLSFLESMACRPVIYVHGNHDTRHDVKPPEGCICADDRVVVRKGVRILGLGGCSCYSGGRYQYTEQQMEKRIKKVESEIRKVGGVDIVLTHVAPKGFGDAEDYAHRGFECFLPLLEKYKPVYLVHGHVHMNYGQKVERLHKYCDTTIINAFERYDLVVDTPLKTADRDEEIMFAERSNVQAITDRLKITGKDSLLYTVYCRMAEQQKRERERK